MEGCLQEDNEGMYVCMYGCLQLVMTNLNINHCNPDANSGEAQGSNSAVHVTPLQEYPSPADVQSQRRLEKGRGERSVGLGTVKRYQNSIET